MVKTWQLCYCPKDTCSVVSVDVDEDNAQTPVDPMELQFVLDSFYVHNHLSVI
ncbi:hypothetical protein GGF39_003829 [Coemansia sp. RSA 1721]|nr:hypothetical protein GGF39_003829 [Coemansia sp. RSA 1721]